jgi:hypothetical protein
MLCLYRVFCLLLCSLLCISCSGTRAISEYNSEISTGDKKYQSSIQAEGILSFKSFESGFYAIDTEDSQYIILNADEYDMSAFKNKTVYFEAVIIEDALNIYMYGPSIQLLVIKVVE